jgi:hypothetical protein
MNDTATQPTDDQMIQEWKLWKDRTAFAQQKERALRATIIHKLFPSPKEGANNLELALDDGRTAKVKLTYPIDRKVDPGELEALTKAAREQPDHPLAGANFDALVRKKPELNKRVYNTLPEDKRIVFDSCLTIKPGSAQLDVQLLELK